MTLKEIKQNEANIPAHLRGKEICLQWKPPGKDELFDLSDLQTTLKDLQATVGHGNFFEIFVCEADVW